MSIAQKMQLTFSDSDTEKEYQKHTTAHTLMFSRIAWMNTVFLASVFGFLDKEAFQEKSHIALIARIIVVLISIALSTLTFSKSFHKISPYSSSIFILTIGLFGCTLLSLSPPTEFSPYFVGIFFAFTGIFITTGLGFKACKFAMAALLIAFEITIFNIIPLPPQLVIIYNFFFSAIFIVFLFMGYYIEKISRDNFRMNSELRETISRINQLNGLLPICASCKNIRDDKGYWNQIEGYIASHSHAEFSHCLCPSCAEKLYPELNLTENSEELEDRTVQN